MLIYYSTLYWKYYIEDPFNTLNAIDTCFLLNLQSHLASFPVSNCFPVLSYVTSLLIDSFVCSAIELLCSGIVIIDVEVLQN